MPEGVVKTKRDEVKWEKAKQIVSRQYPDLSEDDDGFWKLVNKIYQGMRKANPDNMDREVLRKAAEVSFIWPGYDDVDSDFIFSNYLLLKSHLDELFKRDVGKADYSKDQLKGLNLRWVTIRGQHVLVHGQADGSYVVVGGASGKLNHFKIDKLLSEQEYRKKLTEREKTKSHMRELTPEEIKEQEEKRKRELAAKEEAKKKYEESVSQITGKELKSRISVEDLDEINLKAKDRVKKKLEGKEVSEEKEKAMVDREVDKLTEQKEAEKLKNIEKSALDTLIDDYLGGSKDPADKQSLEEALDPEKAKQVLAAKREFRKKVKEINKGVTKDDATNLEVSDTWAIDSGAINEAAIQEVLQHVETMKNIELYEKLDTQGRAIQKHIDTGALQAFNGIIGDTYETGAVIGNKMVSAVGIEGCARLLAAKMIADGKGEEVKKALIDYTKENNMRVVDNALGVSDSGFKNADEIRKMASDLEGSDAILSRASANGYALRQIVEGQKTLGDAVGSLRTAAHLINALEEKPAEKIHFDLGTELARARKKARAMGLRRGEYKLKTEGSKLVMELDTSLLNEWFERNGKERAHELKIEDIKAHKLNDGYVPKGMKSDIKLDAAQEAGLKFFAEQNNVILDFEAGLGKTAVGYAAAMEAMNNKGAKKILVVTPAKLRSQFYQEREKFLEPDKQKLVTLNDGGPTKRAENYKKDGITIIGHEQLRTDRKLVKDANYDMIVIDEFHELTNPSENAKSDSQRFEGMMDLSSIPLKIGMSGTNIKNAKRELFKKIAFIDPNNTLGTSADFESRYKGINQGSNAFTDSSLDAFRKEIAPWIYTQKNVLKVKNNINETKVTLTPAQRQAYKDSERMYTQEKGQGSRGAASRRDQRNYDIIHDGDIDHNGKILKIKDIMNTEHAGEKAVIHMRGRKALQTLKEALEKEYGEGSVVLVHGDTPKRQADDAKAKFNDPDSKVRFILGTKSLEAGHNLQKGGTVTIHFDIPDTQASFDQRNKRIYRRGQERDTNTYLLVSEAPYDISRKDILTRKKKEMGIIGNTRHVEGYDESGVLSALNHREPLAVGA